jgi:ankyrin repeat protein
MERNHTVVTIFWACLVLATLFCSVAEAATDLQNAVEDGDLKLANRLLERGANVSETSFFSRRTPIQMAAVYGNTDIVALLLEYGADPNSAPQGESFLTPLQHAISNDDLKTAKVLINGGANVNFARGKENETPLIEAIRLKRTTMAQLLVESGADVNMAVIENQVPIHAAIAIDDAKLTAYLLEQGADPQRVSKSGWVAIHYAARRNRPDVVTALLKYGADINAHTANEIKATPLHIAIDRGSADFVEFLLDNGANINSKAMANLTPLEMAKSFQIQSYTEKRQKVIELLIRRGAR